MNEFELSVTNNESGPYLKVAENTFIKIILNGSQNHCKHSLIWLEKALETKECLGRHRYKNLNQYLTLGNVRCGLCFPGKRAP